MNAPLRGIVAYPITPFTNSGRVDEALMRDVTAVFQVVDALCADARAKAGRRNPGG